MGIVFFFLLFMIPIWGVREAELLTRILLTAAVLLTFFVGHREQDKAKRKKIPAMTGGGPASRLTATRVGLGALWLLTIATATSTTYGPDALGFGLIARSEIYAGEWIFPVVAKYKSLLSLEPLPLYRLQGFMSSILIVGLITTILLAVRNYRRRYKISEDLKARAGDPQAEDIPGLVVFCAAFSIAVFLLAYLGLIDFDPHLHRAPRGCLVEAACYAHFSDLGLFVPAGMKLFMMFLLPYVIMLYGLTRQMKPRDGAGD